MLNLAQSITNRIVLQLLTHTFELGVKHYLYLNLALASFMEKQSMWQSCWAKYGKDSSMRTNEHYSHRNQV